MSVFSTPLLSSKRHQRFETFKNPRVAGAGRSAEASAVIYSGTRPGTEGAGGNSQLKKKDAQPKS